MAVEINSEKSIAQQLLDQVSLIAERYEELFAQNEDAKALQGLERCVELMMKICGIDGKQTLDLVPTADRAISLAELPIEQLQLIVNHIKTLSMQQQQK